MSIVIKVPYKKSISNNTSEMLMEVRGILNVPSVERDSTANITGRNPYPDLKRQITF